MGPPPRGSDFTVVIAPFKMHVVSKLAMLKSPLGVSVYESPCPGGARHLNPEQKEDGMAGWMDGWMDR
ncbi:hypothetical protein AMEX_G15507 [Astyanax mexicanus]|uniref:Uncharacterized protein n=1 Tax=Astyanax mexicanus TaxID=7994 RepID=A0A8T2LMA3_ASTMX|nr:hypothetical protein AMEX_G15507 [Astyanax mexicanus]